MKLRHVHILVRQLLRLLACLIVLGSGAQAANFNLKFSNPGTCPAATAGANAAVGSSCRYLNVVTDAAGTPLPTASSYQRDVIITLSKLTGGAVITGTTTNPNAWDNDGVLLDSAGAPHPEFFTPTVTAPNTVGATSWAEFTVQFVPAGGSSTTTAPLPGSIHMTSFDTDGSGATNGLREFIEFVAPAASGLSGTPASADQPGTAVDGGSNYEAITVTNQPAIGSGAAYKASAQFAVPGVIRFAVGARQGIVSCAGACERLSAYSFQMADSVLLTPTVDGYKSVKLTTDADSNGVVTPGDTLTYTVIYTNTGNAAVTNFQVSDTLPAGVTAATGAQTVRLNGTVTAGARNSAYTGSGTTTLLTAGQTLPVGGSVSIDLPVTVGAVSADNSVLSNQTTSSGTYTTAAGVSVALTGVSSDNVDTTTVFPPSVAATTGFTPVPTGSLTQTQATTTDPTTVTVRRPPQLTFSKSVAAPGRANAADQFTVQIKNGTTVTASASTTGTGTSVSTAVTTLASGAAYTLTEVMATGSVSPLTSYDAAIVCTNTATGSATVLPGGAGQSFTLTPALGDVISCTLTNTARTYALSGQVFEDYNYGGGAGRAYAAASGMSLRPGVRAELFNAAGTFLSAAFTDASGAYSFSGQLPGSYTVRVVNSFVTSSRGGGCAVAVNVSTPPATCTQLPVQTYVYGNVNRVGGESPATADPALSTTTLPAGAESIAAVSVGAANLSGIDFGFNFDTIVSSRDAGQGTLRQFLINSNALANTGLAQSGLTAGSETSIFMVPDGLAHAGQTAGLATALTGGVAVITPATALPAVTDALTILDGGTQTANIGDTNAGTLGTGGTVGTDALALPTLVRPEVQISGTSAIGVGLDLQASSVTVRNVSVLGFGSAANSDAGANIRIGNNFTADLIERNYLGMAATRAAFDCKSGVTAATGTGDNIRSVGADSGTVQNNLIGCSAGKGFGVENTSNGWTITGNEIRGNAIGNANLDGIDLENGSSGALIRGNLIVNHEGVGVDGYSSGGANRTENNTISGNGIGTAANLENAGVRVFGNGSTVYRNIISGNNGAGVLVVTFNGVPATGNTISQNSIYDNGTTGAVPTGQIGIDLGSSTDSLTTGTSPFVTKNDSGDTDAGANGLLNFPVFGGAIVNAAGTTLTVSGYARPGSLIELFVAAPDPTGFGEGKTYLTSVQEGSTADLDSGTGCYATTATAGCLTTPAGTDTTNRFRFSLLLSNLPGVGIGTLLTATATCLSAGGCTDAPSGSTSEFSANLAATGTPLLNLVKQERNCGAVASGVACSGTFVTAVNVKPADVIEYCIDYTNAGNAAAASIVLTDLVPTNTTADLNGYAAGKGISVTAGGTTTLYTSAAGDDVGTLTSAQLSLSVPTLAVSGTGRVCFRAAVR